MSVARLVVDLLANTESFKRDMQSAAQTMDRAGRDMQRVGRNLSTRVTLPLVGIGAAAIKMSVDAEEAANKFNVVMGEAADDVRRRFRDLQDTIPLTQDQMESLAAGVQDLLVPLGFVRSEAAGMSADMVELAADLASFNNVAASVPLEALKSGLAGQSRPLRQFGIDVSQARLELLALEEGLISQGQELTASARAQAIMIAATRDSADAIGDAARTADSAANSFRFLKRDLMELGQGIGDIIVPAILPMVHHLRDVVRVMREMSPETQRLVVGIGAVAAAIGPLLVILGTLIRSLAALAVLVSPAGLIIAGLTAVAALLTGQYVRAKMEAARETREFEEALQRAGREMRTFGEEAARVTLQQFQRNLLEAQARVEDLEQRMKQAQEDAPAASGRLGLGLERIGMTGEAGRLRQELEAAREEVERAERLLQEARKAFFSAAEGAGGIAEGTKNAAQAAANLLDAMEGVASVTASALDLDLERDGLLADALSLAHEFRGVAEDTTRDLEERVRAQRKHNELIRSATGHMDRLLASSMQLAGSTDLFKEGLLELPDAARNPVRSMYGHLLDGAQEGADGISRMADLFQSHWLTAIQTVGSSLGGLASQVANVASAFAIGGPVAGGIALGGMVLGDLFGRGGGQENREQEAAMRRSIDALRDWTAAIRGSITELEQQRVDTVGLLADAIQASLPRGVQIDFSGVEEGLAGWAEAIGKGTDSIDNLMGWFEALARQVAEAQMPSWASDAQIDAAAELWLDSWMSTIDEWVDAARAIEEARQRSIASMEDSLAVRMLVAQGRDAEADLMRLQQRHAKELAEARELEDDALVQLMESVQAAERAAMEATQAERDLAAARREAELGLSLAAREAALWGTSLEATTAQARAAAEAERNRARAMLEAGDISEGTMHRWLRVIDGELVASVRAAEQAMRDAARAAWEAAEAERFRQQQDLQSLQMRLLRAQGQDAEALQLQQLMELERALFDGRDSQYVQLLQMVQAEEARARALQESARAAERTTQQMDRMATVMNAPTGLPLALRRFQAATTGSRGGTSPIVSGGRTSQVIDNSVRIERIEVQTYPGETGEDFLRKIEAALAKRSRRGTRDRGLVVVDS